MLSVFLDSRRLGEMFVVVVVVGVGGMSIFLPPPPAYTLGTHVGGRGKLWCHKVALLLRLTSLPTTVGGSAWLIWDVCD